MYKSRIGPRGMKEFFVIWVQNKQVIHPQIVWDCGPRYIKVESKLNFFNDAVSGALATGKLSCLDILLSMQNSFFSAEQDGCSYPVFDDLWKETVPVEAAKKVLELLLVKHWFLDLNWFTGFADNLIAQIEKFSEFFAQGKADP